MSLRNSILVLGLLVCAACGGGGSGNSSPANNESPEDFSKKVQTQCSGPATQGTDLKGGWYQVNKNGDVILRTKLNISANDTTAEMTCSEGRDNTTVKVQVPSSYDSRSITFAKEAHDQKTAGNITCHIGLPAATVQYQISGSCLGVSVNNQTLVFLRQ